MKKYLNVQLPAGTNNNRTDQGFSPVPNNEFYPTSPGGLCQPVLFQKLFNILNNINPAGESYKNILNPSASGQPEIRHSDYTVKKIDGNEVTMNPFLKNCLQKAAVRLSDIELSIYHNDLSRLQFAVLVLKDVLHDMKLPSAIRLCTEMEELANEKRLQEVNGVLLKLKKIIAGVVQYN